MEEMGREFTPGDRVRVCLDRHTTGYPAGAEGTIVRVHRHRATLAVVAYSVRVDKVADGAEGLFYPDELVPY
jgi:hypothetical protein